MSASATFTTGAGTLLIALSDLLSNPTSIGQTVSGLTFAFTPSVTGTSTLASSSGTEVTISNHTPAVGGPVDTGWGFGTFNVSYILCIICPNNIQPPYHTAPPSHLIIGPGPYSNANSSIEVHSPNLYQTANFTITNSNITAGTSITSVTFFFGTGFGEGKVEGVKTVEQVVVPEPASSITMAAAFGMLCLIRSRIRKHT